MSAFGAARSVFRSAAGFRSAGARLAGAAKPKATRSPFCVPSQKLRSSRIFRSPVEMSCVPMLPFHTATASALLTSMLSSTPRRYGWTLEEIMDYHHLAVRSSYQDSFKVLEADIQQYGKTRLAEDAKKHGGSFDG